MKIPFYISTGAAALCLILSIVVFSVGLTNQTLQTELQKQQQELQKQQVEIDSGNQSMQVGQNLLRDMATSSVKNVKMKDLLAKHGYNVQVKDAPKETPAGTPAPKTNP